jgi:hypothetical protein
VDPDIVLANGTDTYTDANGETTITVNTHSDVTLNNYLLKPRMPSIVPGANCCRCRPRTPRRAA